MNLIRWQNKLSRTLSMLGDKSEIFDERPSFRWEIIIKIWEEK
jgi:hypothetical protein